MATKRPLTPGRPGNSPMVGARLPADRVPALRALIDRTGRSQAEIVRTAVLRYLDEEDAISA